MAKQADAPLLPQPGDRVEMTYRGTYERYEPTSPDDRKPHLIRIDGSHTPVWMPVPDSIRIIDPLEPTTVGTVVTGWRTPDDGRPSAMYVYVLIGTDGDGDGAACWQAPGETHEYRWESVLADTRHGRRITTPGGGA